MLPCSACVADRAANAVNVADEDNVIGEDNVTDEDHMSHNPRWQSWLGNRSNSAASIALLVLAIGSVCLLSHALKSRRS
jgi:hypothetical protein